MIASVMDSSYEGSDYCRGVIAGFEGRIIGQDYVMNYFKSKLFGNWAVLTKEFWND